MWIVDVAVWILGMKRKEGEGVCRNNGLVWFFVCR